MTLAEALDLLGPIRAWVSKDAAGKPIYWLDGRTYDTDHEIKKEAHRIWLRRKQ